MKTAVLLSYADGRVTVAEQHILRDFAAALDVSHEKLVEMETQVKEFLLGHVAHLANTEAVMRVAKKLEG